MDTPETTPAPRPGTELRQALPSDVPAIHALLRPFVMQRLLLSRTQAELVELSRHGFVAMLAAAPQGPPDFTEASPETSDARSRCVGFCAVEVYSPKLAELQCLAVHPDFQGTGVGRRLVDLCVERARDLGVMEIMAISTSDAFLENCGFKYSLPDQKRALFQQLRPRPYEER